MSFRIENTDIRIVECDKCSYEWHTKSDKKYMSCPQCSSRVKNFNEEKITTDNLDNVSDENLEDINNEPYVSEK